MSISIRPTIVYQRRGRYRNSLAIHSTQTSIGAGPSDGCHSVKSSVAAEDQMVSFFECVIESSSVAKAEFNECPHDEEASVSGVDGVSDVACVNDNCSSSKSNLEPNSASLMRIYRDDTCECSSSSALIAEKVPKEMSERDICISILRNQGLLDRVCTEDIDIISDNYCSKPCKVCARLDSTLNMLICDGCVDAFHTSCCNPRITRIPVGEWLCSSCLNNGNSASDGELGAMEFMFRETEPYMSNVRIGDDFQANVPDWSGPIYNECGGWWLETDPSNNVVSMQEQGCTKLLKHSSIGNWLQCQESMEGVRDGDPRTICGKWRRAPLFEFQTDKWVCFCCVLWDPSHADCAVPQELDTEEVMKQLKYVEMLRPQLAAKRRKLKRSKGIGSQDPSY